MEENNNSTIYSIRRISEGNTIKRGDVCICDFDKFEEGSVMYKKRPVLAMSENHFNTVICIPFTTSEIYNLGIGFNLDSSKTSYPRFDRISTISYTYLEPTGMNILTRYPDAYYNIANIFYDIICGKINIIDSINNNRNIINDINNDNTNDIEEDDKIEDHKNDIIDSIKTYINTFYSFSDNSDEFIEASSVYAEFKNQCNMDPSDIPTKQYFDAVILTLGYGKYRDSNKNKIVFKNLTKK